MPTKITKADLFDPAAPTNSRGYQKNALTDGEPDQSLVENWAESIAWKTEDGDRATQSTGSEPVEDLKGLVQIATDAEAKANNNGLEANTTKVPHTGQLPTVAATEAQEITGDNSFNDVVLEIAADGTGTRNNFLAKLKGTFLTWLQSLNNQVDTNTSDIDTLTTSIGGVTPVGSVTMFFGNSAPTNWLIADGTTIGSAASAAANNSDNYEALFTQIWNNSADAEMPVSTGRGGSAAADFAANKTITLPNLSGKTPIGKDSGDTDFNALGKAGGAKDVALSISNIPDHTHDAGGGGNTSSGGAAHAHNYNTYDEFQPITINGNPNNAYFAPIAARTVNGSVIVDTISDATSSTTASHTHSVSGVASGNVSGGAGGSNVDVVNPYQTINFIIKY